MKMKSIIITAVLLAFMVVPMWAQSMTKQQALDEIARIERFNAQVDTMLRQAWEAGRTQRETVIDTPYGKVTIKYNLAEKINSEYTGAERDNELKDTYGRMDGNELQLNPVTRVFKEKDQEEIKWIITHELGHYMDRRPNRVVLKGNNNMYRSHEDITEIEADAFAMRHLDKFSGIGFMSGSRYYMNEFIDAVFKRAFEIEREERENLARLRNIAGLPPQPQYTSTAQSYIESGKAAYDRKEYGKADRYFTLAIGIDQNNAEAYYRRAESRTAQYVSSAGGFADYYKAIKLDPNNNTYKEAHRVAREKQQAADQADNDYDKKIAYGNAAIRRDPNVAYNFIDRGRGYLGRKEYDKAIADFTEALRLNPNSTSGYGERAKAYIGKEEYDKAILDSTEAIRCEPNWSGGYITRAQAYIAKGDYDKAIADCNKAIRLIRPNYADAYTTRAKAYIGKRNYKEARADVDEALLFSHQPAKDLDAELKKMGY